MVSKEGKWSQRRANGLKGGQMVSEEGRWSQRRAIISEKGKWSQRRAMVSKEGKWSQRRAIVSNAVLPLIRSYLVFNQNHHCVIKRKRIKIRAATIAILIESAGRLWLMRTARLTHMAWLPRQLPLRQLHQRDGRNKYRKEVGIQESKHLL